MLVPWIYKVVLGGFIFVGTGVGIGSAILVSTEPENSNLKTTSASIEGEIKEEEPLKAENTQEEATGSKESKSSVAEKEQPEESSEKVERENYPEQETTSQVVVSSQKECTIYKIKSSGSGEVEKVDKSKIKGELGRHYREVEEACKAVGEGDIFLSRKDGRNWRYYKGEQNHSKVKDYVKRHFSSRK